jgi:hypothetical protein
MSGLGMLQAGRDSKRASAAASEDRALSREQMEKMYALAEEAQGKVDTRNGQLRDIELWNFDQQETERLFQIESMEKYQQQLLGERQQEIDRQMAGDREAARLQAYKMDQIVRNQNLSQQERAFAVQQLEQAQAIAAGERDEDLKRLYEDRVKADAQRQFMMGVYDDAQRYATEDQNRDLQVRDRVTGQIDKLQGSLDAAYQAMGAAPTVRRLTEQDIDAEVADREGQYRADLDHAAERVASINEANLIRGGMDRSTAGTERRGDVAARLADEYSSARVRARDDALAYINGEQKALTDNVGAIMGQRGATLQELLGVGSTGLNELMNLPQVRSKLAGSDYARLVGDGIYDRGALSAQYNQSIQSGIYDAGVFDLSPNMSNFTVGTSGAMNLSSGINSAVRSPINLSLTNPASFYSAGNDFMTGSTTASANLAAGAKDASINASSGFGNDLTKWLNDRFGGGNTAGGAPVGQPSASTSGTSHTGPSSTIRPTSRPYSFNFLDPNATGAR